jgi:1,4-dihydroxy-2-naphthoate polyprenyltransferase
VKFSLLIEGARPKTLIASISPVIIGSAIAKSHGNFNFLIFISALITAVFLQIGTNYANDYFDAKKGSDTSDRIGPRRVMQLRLVSKLSMKRAIFISFLIATGSCLYLIIQGGALIAYLLLLAFILGIGYTAGPFALAYIGLGDCVVFLFFGCIATLLTTYLHTGKFLLDALIAGMAPGALSTAILTINNLRDRALDKKSNKKTLIVRFGESFGKCEYTIMLLLAFIIPIIMNGAFHYNSLILLTSLLSFFILILVKEVWLAKSPQDYLPLLPKTALLLTLYTLLFTLGCLRTCLTSLIG